jgi:enoyl-CoA hydratase/carnithine racemase
MRLLPCAGKTGRATNPSPERLIEMNRLGGETMYQFVVYEKRGRVAVVSINRPEDSNRLNGAASLEVTDALLEAEKDPEVHVVVLTHIDGPFCNGGRMDGYPGGTVMDKKRFSNAFLGLQKTIWNLTKPVIAAVHGNAMAGGFCLVECCDLAVAGESCKFGLPELERGNFPMLALASIQKALPKKKVFELAYLGRVLDARTAAEWNLVNLVVPDDKVMEQTMAWAEKIASYSMVAASFGREGYYRMINMDYNDSLEYAKNALISMLSTEDSQEVDRAIREGREPVFKGY